MHLLAAQPGGFSDDEGIIDLAQSPADIVVLAAADSSLGALASAVESMPDGFVSVRLANWMQLLKPSAFDLYRDTVLDHATVIVVSFLGGAGYWPYGFEQLVDWSESKSGRTLVLVPGDDAPDEELLATSSVPRDQAFRVWRFLREGGALNHEQLVRYLASQYMGKQYDWCEPQPMPNHMIYLPALWASESPDPYRQWLNHTTARASGSLNTVCILLFYRSHLQTANEDMFDQLITVLEEQGMQPLPIAITSLKDPEAMAFVNTLVERSGAVLVINTTGFSTHTVPSPELASRPTTFSSPFCASVPVLQLVLASNSESDWRDNSRGLRSRDIAMQVALPEMDGRVLTRPISFKSEAYRSDRCQIPVVKYQLHRERAVFVARLAANYMRLSRKPNANKRIALMLANYPTRDGRIGNGVGLDTPESALQILNAMMRDGYSVRKLPDSGNALIQQLLGAVTNNPETLHHLSCWQSISTDDYQRLFLTLPAAARAAITDRWGDVSTDPKYRNGRIMLAGIRLGDTFVGIQPSRGFNMDLVANYHDPDLVPPHSYLAYYFWLRECYQVDAIVHVGKHGNLEWLPGKGTGLSAECWPDIVLGPTPHFYPFIVNDPGEGAQAKRRAQAVIIDHLMPPMTRAEVYGELAELEALVDEYYQALGMDSRREQWLAERIVAQLRLGNVLKELGCSEQAEDEVVLLELDAYLCDIKEAQIRHGLHILGKLPPTDKLSDTIVALLRLPRGTQPEDQGLLHSLVDDLQLHNNGEVFDPLRVTTKPWQGPRPDILTGISEALWRTDSDTRERLELFAQKAIADYVLGACNIPGSFYNEFPRFSGQLEYARSVLLRALQRSAQQEISALLDGMAGRFVEPGPSGAPTRGRLDTLPTGRNFFSLDNRSIPSAAAWAIGQRSAQALIERHLQDHGDYPRTLGLSVWGTATMRTGGDDIAQAFALMGIKPVWAVGSARVVDFEVVPAQLLQRPRVDVTLRVSGFFRDAFPNVMSLYDAAVQALADFDDPGNLNPIRDSVREQTKALRASGVEPEQARRQASYRVFGSKPGAYGAGLQGLIDERCWDNSEDLAQAYVNWGGFAYGSDKHSQDGVEAKKAFEHRLSQLQVVVQNQDNREHDILDSDDYYQFQGGMANAVQVNSGQTPVVYHNDHSNPESPKIRTLKEELNRVIRSRVLNPKWIEAMREHGYKGAFEMAATVDYLFAYDATTALVDDYQYEQVTDTLVLDEQNQAFMQENNPSALEEMAERLLEATQRGLWRDSADYAARLQELLLDIDARKECSG